ncbi:MAG TPA: molybdenum ABC transporter ATP-binding protein [Paracoccaceae bacterium]|nr:molybdenum ABC transporter ATP-binding protein [Paracoccaceae bacterium]
MRVELDLAARWGDFRLAVRDALDLDGVTALFGPSGSGKTTILAAIAGFRPRLGRIAVDGATWQDGRRSLRPHRRPVGTVFQDGRLFEHLGVEGNLTYAERRADPEGPPIARAEVVEALGLGDLLPRSTATLSGGERQRVAIGRALLARPRLLLMDEPLAALDRVRKASILPLIAALPGRFGTPVLYVSHQIDEIVQIADRLVTVRDGRITGQGETVAMVAGMDPAVTGRFEAGSLLEGPVVELRPEFALLAISIDGARLWLPDIGGTTPGERLRVRIRARDVSLALAPVEGVSIRNQLPARITRVETDDGPFAEIRLDVAGQPLRARITRMTVAELGLAEGGRVWALIKSIAFDRRLAPH